MAFILLFPVVVSAQICDSEVPVYQVDLSNNPDTVWLVPDVQRDGSCCGAPKNTPCVLFEITLHPDAAGINFGVCEGAEPSGALYYQVGCGPKTPVGEPICINDVGPHQLTFCKPGKNDNTFCITSIPKPSAGDDIVVQEGCSGQITSNGFDPNNVNWTSVIPGNRGDYDYLLSCTNCQNPDLNLTGLVPDSIYFEVSGLSEGECNNETGIFRDTVKVTITPGPQVFITAEDKLLCTDQDELLLYAEIQGGTAPYNVVWSNGATGSPISVGPGTYTVSVTDALGCETVTESFTLAPPTPLTLNLSSTPATCNGGTDGSATVTISGGYPAYSIVWNDPQQQQSASAMGLSAGNYTVTVTDSAGCVANATVYVGEPNNPLTIDLIASQNISCKGDDDGSITVRATGGTSPYTYSWSHNIEANSTTQNDLKAGSYTVTVTDANGCVNSITVNLQEPALPVTATIEGKNLKCFNDASGELRVSAFGGTAPYQYRINGGAFQSSPLFSNLSAGNYSITVRDSKGCLFIVSATLSQPESALAAQSVITNPSCFGGSDGEVLVNITGGTAPYKIQWNDPDQQKNNPAVGLSAGSYQVSITDTNGCSVILPVQVTNPPVITINITAQHNLCFNGNTGSAGATVTGGTPPYSYQWNDPAQQTSSTATGLKTGSYTLTVFDSKGCSKTANVTINGPANPLKATVASIKAVNCFGGSDGSATISISGGKAPYSVQWNDANSSTGTTVSGLPSGTYTATVTDANNCTYQITVTITQPNAALAIAQQQKRDVSCFGGSDGSATVMISGGTEPYTITWNDPQAQSDVQANNLAFGSYRVTVVDANGCSAFIDIAINQPSPLTGSVQSTSDVNCKGQSTGSATVAASGGTAPYSFKWSDAAGQTSPSAQNLAAGTYQVTITDSKGCTTVVNVTINEPLESLSAIISAKENVKCKGDSSGSITVTASGGTAPYTYLWSDSKKQITSTASNLTAGIYQVKVTDSKGCITTLTTTLGEPGASIRAVVQVQNHVSCFGGSDGAAQVVISGGSSPYSVFWSPSGATGLSVSNLTAGTHRVQIVDSQSCSNEIEFEIQEPENPLSGTIEKLQDVSCFGGNDGSLKLIPQGGTPPYSYQWNDAGLQNGQTANNLVSGNYSVVLTDANGCTITAQGNIQQPNAALSLSSTVNAAKCNGSNTGVAVVNATGGTAPYFYQWNDSQNQTSSRAENLLAGDYLVVVTDAKGCSQQINVQVTEPSSPLQVNINANPVSCSGQSNGSATALASGGKAPYHYSWNDPSNQNTATANNLAVGEYQITVTDANGCIIVTSIAISEPNPLVLTVNYSEKVCSGTNSGQVSATVTGGTAPYSYFWDDQSGTTSNTASGLPAGTYTVTVTDANGCESATSVTLNEAVLMELNLAAKDPSCFGVNDASVISTITGGQSPYTYAWLPDGESSKNIINKAAGTYTLRVTDNQGCSIDASATVNPVNDISLSSIKSDVTCFGRNDGSAIVTATGGKSPYQYAWNDAAQQKTPSASNLAAGNYVCTVTDAKGCSKQISVNINENPSIAITLNPSEISCFGESNGSISSLVNGGNPPYQYQWSDLQSTATAVNLKAGLYGLTVSDQNGCSVTKTTTINQPAEGLSAVLSFSNVACKGSSTGNAQVLVSGGTPGYLYQWNDALAQNTATASQLAAGNYQVLITDAKGCNLTKSVVISEPQNPLEVAVTGTAAKCKGSATGIAEALVTGGVSPYAFLWNDSLAQTNATALGLRSGLYQVMVSDAQNCQISASVFISEPSENINITTTANEITCFGDKNGVAQANVTGGVAPYSYQWNDFLNQETPTADSLPAGSYQITVNDGVGCQATATAIIVGPSNPIQNAFTLNPISCAGGSDGSIVVSTTGGTSPFRYQWNDNLSTQNDTLQNIASGYYKLITKDAKNCERTDSIFLAQPDSLKQIIDIKNISCRDAQDGFGKAFPQGGKQPYTYNWDNAGFSPEQSISNLGPGFHTVETKDNNGCTVSSNFEITQPQQALRITAKSRSIKCFGASSGLAWVEITGGTSPYEIAWNDAQAQKSDTAFTLVEGNYIVVVEDNNGCIDSSAVSVKAPSEPLSYELSTTPAACFNETTGSAGVEVSGGTPGYTFLWNDALAQTGAIANQLKPGEYLVKITDANGCEKIGEVEITGPEKPLQLAISSKPVSCFGASDGTVEAFVNGGSAPYAYAWNVPGGAFSKKVENLPVGDYSIEVTDVKNCKVQGSISVYGPKEPLKVTITNTEITCFGLSNGTATANVLGGAEPYTYAWNDPAEQTNRKATDLALGFYNVTVKDQFGCSATAETEILGPNEALQVKLSANPTSCFGFADGLVNAEAFGGTAPYVYNWNIPNAGTESNIDNLAAGFYTIDIFDANNCRTRDTISLSQPNPLLATLDIVDVSCYNGTNGSVTVNAMGGSPKYDYLLNGNQQSAFGEFQNLIPGNHNIKISDVNGCVYERLFFVDEPDALEIDTVVQDVVCNGQDNGAVRIKVLDGGTVPYQISWNGGSYQDTAIFKISTLSPGQYQFIVRDANNCQNKHFVNIEEPTPLNINASDGDTLCPGASITLTANVSGGVGNLVYQWNQGLPSQPSHTVIPFANTVYVVQGRDQNNCYSESKIIPVFLRNMAAEELRIIAEDSACSKENMVIEAFHKFTTVGYKYTWDPALGDHLGPFNYKADSSRTITLTVTNVCNDTLRATHDIVVVPSPELFIGDTAALGCAPLNLYLLDTVNTNTGILQYNWTLGDGSSSTRNPLRHTYNTPGEYNLYLSITNPQGCSVSSSSPHKVIVNPSPDAYAEASNYKLKLSNAKVDFYNLGEGYTSWFWDFGNGDSSFVLNPSYQYPDTGHYQAVLHLVNQYGCTDQYPLNIAVEPYIKFVVPTGFTPNPGGGNGGSYNKNDLSNDVFYPMAEYVETFSMQIFNRWGELVFESKHIDHGWDGYYKGRLAQQDVYIWKITASFVGGEQITETGNLTLIWKE